MEAGDTMEAKATGMGLRGLSKHKDLEAPFYIRDREPDAIEWGAALSAG